MPQFGEYPSVVTLNLSDTMLVLQTGSVKQASLDDLETLIGDSSRWVVIESNKYTSTPASDTSITMADTAGLAAGLPIRVTQGGTLYYLIISSVTTNTSIAVNGPALGATAITQLEVGKPEQVVELRFQVLSTYANGTTSTLLLDDNKQVIRWRQGKAYMVQASFLHGTADSTSGPIMQVRIASSGVIADNTNSGVQVVSAATWYDSTKVQSANYDLVRGDAVELQVTTAGGTGNCQNLNASLVFVLE